MDYDTAKIIAVSSAVAGTTQWGFDHNIVHVPGETNQLANSLSRIYSDEAKGTVHAVSEYVSVEEENSPSVLILNMVSSPVYTNELVHLNALNTRSVDRAIQIANGEAVPPPKVRKPLDGEDYTEPTTKRKNKCSTAKEPSKKKKAWVSQELEGLEDQAAVLPKGSPRATDPELPNPDDTNLNKETVTEVKPLVLEAV